MGETESQRNVRFAEFVLDLTAGELHKAGWAKPMQLPEQPLRVLRELLKHPGQMVSREELIQKLWPGGGYGDFDHGLNKAVNKLRETLGDSAETPKYIETVARRGYRFVAPVDVVREAPTSPAGEGAAPMPSPRPSLHEDRLDSWKEIASYLNRDVRTVQRWEKISGLPFHRLQIEKAGTVYAYKSELDAWWKERQSSIEIQAEPNRSFLTKTWIVFCLGLLALFVGGIVLLRVHKSGQNKLSSISSLAVLSLENLTGDPAQEYLSDGITNALITRLAQIPGLRVISRTSTLHYKGTRKTLPEIAHELHVDAIVEGSVTRRENTINVSAQLIQAETDSHLSAANYSRPLEQIPQLEGLVAEDLILPLRGRLPSADIRIVSNPATTHPEAYEAYLKGILFFDKQNPDDMRTAIRYFQLAIEKDANYAAAYAHLSECFLFLSDVAEIPTTEAFSKAQAAADQALSLDENLEQAHTARARIFAARDWDWLKAEEELQRAISSNPNSSFAHGLYAELLLIHGKPEQASEQVRAAKAVDPVSLPTLLYAVFNLYFTRRYDEALSQSRTALELYPDSPLLHVYLSNTYLQNGQYDEAMEELLRSEELFGAPSDRLAALRSAYQASGSKGLRRKRIELNIAASGKQFPNAYDLAIDYASLGNKDQSVEWLQKAYRVRDPKITLIGIEPLFDVLRSDPRFKDLSRRIGLPLDEAKPGDQNVTTLHPVEKRWMEFLRTCASPN